MSEQETQTEQRAIEQLRAHTDAVAMRRERIAMAALQGLLAGPLLLNKDGSNVFSTKADVCEFAVDYADALISELDRKEPEA